MPDGLETTSFTTMANGTKTDYDFFWGTRTPVATRPPIKPSHALGQLDG